MNIELLQTFLDRHGADPAFWPAHERAAVERLIASDGEAHALFEEARHIDIALSRYAMADTPDAASLARVTARLNGPLPRQKRPFWRLPAILLDWQFAPAWPRMAALAGCAAVGFAIGISGLDRQIDGQQSLTAASTDLPVAVFEAEPFTEVRP